MPSLNKPHAPSAIHFWLILISFNRPIPPVRSGGLTFKFGPGASRIRGHVGRQKVFAKIRCHLIVCDHEDAYRNRSCSELQRRHGSSRSGAGRGSIGSESQTDCPSCARASSAKCPRSAWGSLPNTERRDR